ncbi:SDR family NAD(P)-dependent oxidoreductase [Oceanibacterium hippocampi]|uniref:3-oxoacyl-[acyl-carrier-protein] reductase FabG n=1 Tax=Oceanibacterium hippocampi TaxID=745714 RepID=A0A1Y5TUU1_9PROT|nr:SDR family NAD(P)-dependent oxidoreductase [Oceanibacterium hippocampi]SLN73042.1 3-oxoacyl-[acyl-carrier-protein] reductase FabG [Oceanibacterium hippocampi]
MTRTDPGIAWITGASYGIGRAVALRLAADGWRVAASARSADALKTLGDEAGRLPGSIAAYPLDLTDGPAIAATVARIRSDLGPIDQAILNAGSHEPTGIDPFETEIFERLIRLNLLGTVHCVDALLPAMRERGRGRIAVVASVVGYGGLPGAAAYGMTKAGLINMCQALRPELERAGIILQIVNPGFVRTPLTDRNDFPMPMLMEVEDAAEAFVRGLASDRFEIVFPRRFAFLMKLLGILPYPLFFAATRRMLRKPGKRD